MSAQEEVAVVLDNVRSLYNVGAVMRVCDGAGVRRLLACGITPYPSLGRADPRRGPVASRADRELRKTALAAYDTVRVEHHPSTPEALAALRASGAAIVAVEAIPDAPDLWRSAALDARPLALVFGHETEGLAPQVLVGADSIVRIPMLGSGKSLNVAAAVAVVLYEALRRQSART
ncbi:MAG TPA: TrmH family RNA methyltransferase [Chloroflexota bacterium]|nr:TrmH family RNA methyltransferase [Chloroflexota bacterium]